MWKIKLQKIVGNLLDELRKLYMNRTVIEKCLAIEILGDICFSWQIFYRKQSLGVPALSIIFPPQINSLKKQSSSSLQARSLGRLFSQATKSIVILKKTLKTYVFSFPGKDETREQTNFLDKLSVGDQFINKSQNKMVIHLIFSVQPFSC